MAKKVALIGCGYWGKNYVNTIKNIEELELKYVCDPIKPAVRLPEKTNYTKNIGDVLNDASINGVIIATPTGMHYSHVKQALQKGKDILVEKPITLNSEEASELVELAEEKGLELMVGHIFKYNNAIREIKKKIDIGEIGELRYIESRRVGLGPIRKDASVLWDFATHDIYIAEYLTGKKADSVSCTGTSHNGKIDDIAVLNLIFRDINVPAMIYVNWEHPVKERKTVIGGSKKSILFDDVEAADKIVIYERGIDFLPETGDFGLFTAVTKTGDTYIPRLIINQPLEEEIRHFSKVMQRKENCLSNGFEGLRVVKILEAAEESRKKNGAEVDIK